MGLEEETRHDTATRARRERRDARLDVGAGGDELLEALEALRGGELGNHGGKSADEGEEEEQSRNKLAANVFERAQLRVSPFPLDSEERGCAAHEVCDAFTSSSLQQPATLEA